MLSSFSSKRVPRVRGHAVIRPLGESAGPRPKGRWLVRSEGEFSYRVLALSVPPGERRLSAAPPHPRLANTVVRLASPRRGAGNGPPRSAGSDAALVDLAPGGSLVQLCEEGLRASRLSREERAPVIGEARTVSLLREVVAALRHLHRNRTPHGAVGPRSVLFDADGRVRLCWPAGAPDRADARADLRALGALAWFMLSGSEAPDERSRPPVSSLFTVDRRLSALIEEALSPRRARPPSLLRWARVLRRVDRRLQGRRLSRARVRGRSAGTRRRALRRRQAEAWEATLPSDSIPEVSHELVTQRLPIISR